MKTTITLLSLIIFASCGQMGDGQHSTDESETEQTASARNSANKTISAVADLAAKSGSDLEGKVTFTEMDGKVLMKAELRNMKPGNHAIHIHESGDCNSEDGKSAGGHWNPTNEDHGKWEKSPFHRGDIGNLVVNADGTGSIERETDLWCIDCNDETKNIVGKAIIVHEGPDDFTSQPAGAAGDRIGCGEIVKQ